MTKSTDNASEPSATNISFPNLDMTRLNGDLLSAYAKAGQAMFENAVALNQEVMRFAAERSEANAQIFQDLCKCSNWGEAVAIESDFVRSTADAYLVEMPTLTELAGKTCTATWGPLFESARTMSEADSKS